MCGGCVAWMIPFHQVVWNNSRLIVEEESVIVLTNDEKEFLEASRAFRDREIQQKIKTSRFLKRLTIAASVTALLAIGLAVTVGLYARNL